MPDLAIILPAYNVENTIQHVLTQLRHYFQQAAIIVVNDGSTDRTGEILQQFQDIHVIDHTENLGKGAALKQGIELARAKIRPKFYAFLDSDGQHEAKDLFNLYQAARLNQGDFLIGKRVFRIGSMPLARIISNRLTSWLISRKIGHRIADSQSGMRIVSAAIIEQLPSLYSNGYEFESEFLLKAGRMPVRFFELPITTKYADEQSHIRPLRDIYRFIRVFLRA